MGGRGERLAWLPLIVAFFTAVLARRRAAAVASLLIGYIASVWPPWRIGEPDHATVGFALGLAIGLLFLLSVAEVIRARGQRWPPWSAAGRRRCCGGPGRSACGSRGTCTTWWRTISR